MKDTCGVYAITALDGQQYVGSSRNIFKRWREHRFALRRGVNKNKPLQESWNRNESLVFEILLICSPESLLMYEQIALDALVPSFNVCQFAGSHRGVQHSVATKADMSARQMGEKNRWFGMSGEKSPTARATICATTGMRFVSGKAAADWLRENGYPSATQGKISDVCLGKRKSAYGHAWHFA